MIPIRIWEQRDVKEEQIVVLSRSTRMDLSGGAK